MSGIDCLSHYCTVVRYQHLKSDLTVILRIGDMIKLLVSFFPLVSHLSGWLVELSCLNGFDSAKCSEVDLK